MLIKVVSEWRALEVWSLSSVEHNLRWKVCIYTLQDFNSTKLHISKISNEVYFTCWQKKKLTFYYGKFQTYTKVERRV